MLLFILLLTGIGLIAGLLGGLLGLSGGIITVPCLIYLFKLYEFPATYAVQLAIGTSLAAMIFNAISSMKTHHKIRAINWKLARRMFPGLVIGCMIGVYIGRFLPSNMLQTIFGIFAVMLSGYFYFYRQLPNVSLPELPGILLLNALSFGVGALSGILGIGGSTVTVPLLIKLKIPLKLSIATSTVAGLIISFLGAVGYLILGLNQVHHKMTVGFIYIPAFLILSVTTYMTAPYGARLTHKLPTDRLKKIFAVCLVAVGVIMIIL